MSDALYLIRKQGGERMREKICALQRQFTVSQMFELYKEHCEKVFLSRVCCVCMVAYIYHL